MFSSTQLGKDTYLICQTILHPYHQDRFIYDIDGYSYAVFCVARYKNVSEIYISRPLNVCTIQSVFYVQDVFIHLIGFLIHAVEFLNSLML